MSMCLYLCVCVCVCVCVSVCDCVCLYVSVCMEKGDHNIDAETPRGTRCARQARQRLAMCVYALCMRVCVCV